MARRNKKKLTGSASGASGMPQAAYADVQVGRQNAGGGTEVPAIGTSGMPQAAYADTLLARQNDPVGRGHVPKVREAADSTGEQGCTELVVPTRGGDMSPPYREFCKVIGREQVRQAYGILQKYKSGKANLEQRLIQNEQ